MATGIRQVDDYSFSRPAMSGLAHGVMRYLYGNGKGLTASEVATLRGAGKILGLNYEAGAGDFNGAAAGRAHAVAAAGFAARLPIAKAPIIFSADWPVTVTQFRSVGDALEAAAGILGWGWVGLYGHAGLMDYVAGRFSQAVYRWNTYAWSGGRVSSHADLYQFSNGQNVPGGQVDFNQLVGRNFLTALGGSVTPAGAGSTPLTPSTPAAPPPDQEARTMRYFIQGAPDSQYPGDIFQVVGSDLLYVGGGLDDPQQNILKDALNVAGLINARETNGRVQGVLNPVSGEYLSTVNAGPGGTATYDFSKLPKVTNLTDYGMVKGDRQAHPGA